MVQCIKKTQAQDPMMACAPNINPASDKKTFTFHAFFPSKDNAISDDSITLIYKIQTKANHKSSDTIINEPSTTEYALARTNNIKFKKISKQIKPITKTHTLKY